MNTMESVLVARLESSLEMAQLHLREATRTAEQLREARD